jgi:hypothetical protein
MGVGTASVGFYFFVGFTSFPDTWDNSTKAINRRNGKLKSKTNSYPAPPLL